MQSRYSTTDLEQFTAALGAGVPADLAARVYTSRLLGSDTSLVLYGGGNTSAKGVARDLLGDEQPVLWVKGSGADLDGIGPAGFPACRLGPLLRMCELPSLSDEDMVKGLRGQMLDPSSPTPSVEALLHALIPAKFVDHTHADAVLALVDRPDGEALVRSIFGERALFLPYVMPGFVLARAVRELFIGAQAGGKALPSVMILDKHGIFTWGETAQESYERMIAAVSEVEAFLGREVRPVAAVIEATASAEVLPALRGALAKAAGRAPVLALRSTEATRSFSRRADLATVTQVGCATPDHVIRTKPWPMLLEPGADRASSERSIADFAGRYGAYFERGSAELAARGDATPRKKLDPWPRVVVVPGLGFVGVGSTLKEATAAARIYEQTAGIIERAAGASRFAPVGEVDLFELEYWSLEQAKLGKAAGRAGALEGKVALVTGAGSGIGLATAELFLGEGAHVLVTDRSEEALAAARARLARFGGQAAYAPCDVSSGDSVAQAFSAVVQAFGGVDLVVSNAGGAFQGDLHTDEGDAALLRSLELNLLSHQRVVRAASRVLLAQKTGGALLFNASKSAFNQGPGFGPYAVPKAALVSLVRQYAIDLAPHGIRASAVNADRIRTALFGGGLLEARAKARGVTVDSYFRANLLDRETLASDVARAFAYLATAEATTGCVITVDGGNAAAFVR